MAEVEEKYDEPDEILVSDSDSEEPTEQFQPRVKRFNKKVADISYEDQKERFELEHFMIERPHMFVREFINRKGVPGLYEYKRTSFKDVYDDVRYTEETPVLDKKTNTLTATKKECSFILRWLGDRHKRCYQQLIFTPDPNYVDTPKYYNLFKGFRWTRANTRTNPFRASHCKIPTAKAIADAKKKDIENRASIQPLLHHIKKRLCKNNDVIYDYAINWLAHIIQFPHKKTKVAFVMKSKEGAGKGLLVMKMMEIIGSKYFVQPTAPKQIIGDFNGLLANKCIAYLDELAWGGDKEASGVLKKLLTELTICINKKNMPIYELENFINLFISSNEDWVVPAVVDGRRYFVLDLDNEIAGKHNEYNKSIIDAIVAVDARHFADFLYERDLSNFDPGEFPDTEGLRNQIKQSMSGTAKWWEDLSDSGEVDGIELSKTRLKKQDIFDMFQKSQYKNKYITKRLFFEELKGLSGCVEKETTYGNQKSYRYIAFI
jgi:hypothetical protein